MIDQSTQIDKDQAIDLLKENFFHVFRDETHNGKLVEGFAVDSCAYISIELIRQAIGYGSTLTTVIRDAEGYVTGSGMDNALHDFISTRASIAKRKGNPGIDFETDTQETA